ncbi:MULTISPECIES: DUF2304 domain-containing protein [unclassified Paenibacillus]|uniref:DUF2304 domain-containing protein n=1 Tax=unclassified Paenibacillus TaxID=185978 RepID=UPI001AE460B9|nr:MULTISPECIES: DUF2304 domain-containing protein [unclassified Paenibacillus]MBP1154249.1 hypothetical protein [Paenibacillus sp. PvP091]MBP1170366.1 hypothetical protein [Paenibacillus sp. PvR098]MBP2441394.1 hypothetical protein [Paenibacillus sp. PvP052]
MHNILHYFLLLCGFLFFGTVVILLMKHKISEKISMVWLSGSLVIFVLSGNHEVLDWIAGLLGIQYAPSLLFLFSTLVLLLIVLYMSIQVSNLNDKLKELGQFMALHTYSESQHRVEEHVAGHDSGKENRG